jgi:hypothetical protein
MSIEFLQLKVLEDLITGFAPIFESRIILFIALLTALISFQQLFLRLPKKNLERYGRVIPVLMLSFVTILVLFSWATFTLMFIEKPEVIHYTPDEGEYMRTGSEEFKVVFDNPVDPNTVQLNISPEIKGEWKWEEIAGIGALQRKATFYPEESIYPGSDVVVYVTGIRNFMSSGKLHEYSIEFNAPRIPQIMKTTPSTSSKSFPVEEEITVKYSSPLGEFVDIDYFLTPSIEFEVVESDDFTHQIRLEEKLLHDQEYRLVGLRKLRSFDTKSSDSIRLSRSEKILDISFRTDLSQGILSYSPKGYGTRIDQPLKVEFSSVMDRSRVEESFSITPEIDGALNWESDTELTFTPKNDLRNGTRYSLSLLEDIGTNGSEKTEDDLQLSFKTVGAVRAESILPYDDYKGVDVNLEKIEVLFNQPVNKSSAESSFSVTPDVPGSFRWDGSKLIYLLKEELDYSTQYEVELESGIEAIFGLPSESAFTTSFITSPDDFKIPNISYMRQEEDFTCNIAAARTVLDMYGINRSEDQIRDKIGRGDDPNQGWVSGYGVHIDPVVNYIGQYRTVKKHVGWNRTSLLREVKKGNPVMLWWYNRYSQPKGAFTLDSGVTGYMGMHSEVVYGYAGTPENPTAIYILDPWRGYLTYTPALFDSTWSYMNNTALVVY